MAISDSISKWVLVYSLFLLCPGPHFAVSVMCDFSVHHGNDLYSFILTRPTSKYPHGVLSEDGFYKVAVNETVLWFQLCDQMIFNHDPPQCFGCEGCGGEMRCGMMCSALVATDEGGYGVCKTIGQTSTANVALIDSRNPRKGVTVKMSSGLPQTNCSLTVSVVCDPSRAQEPYSLNRLGGCHYATEMKHPSGCAVIISGHGRGWGWLGTLIFILLCLLGGYLLAGAVYRFFFLGIRGVEVIPNLQFWVNLPHALQSLYGSLLRKIRSYSQRHQSSYGPINY